MYDVMIDDVFEAGVCGFAIMRALARSFLWTTQGNTCLHNRFAKIFY